MPVAESLAALYGLAGALSANMSDARLWASDPRNYPLDGLAEEAPWRPTSVAYGATKPTEEVART